MWSVPKDKASPGPLLLLPNLRQEHEMTASQRRQDGHMGCVFHDDPNCDLSYHLFFFSFGSFYWTSNRENDEQ